MISSESCDLLKFKLDASHTVCQPELRSAAANMKAIIMGLYGEGDGTLNGEGRRKQTESMGSVVLIMQRGAAHNGKKMA